MIPEPVSAAAPLEELHGVLCDAERLRRIAEIDLLAPELRGGLERLTLRTTDRLHQPIALVTMVLDSAQLVAASSGLDGWLAAAGGTPVEWSFCARAVGSRQPYVVNDARTHPIQRSNPLVAIDNIGCYAGVPLYSPDGHALGAHCVVGTEPHDFTAEEIEELQEAGDEIAVLLETYRRQSAA